MNEQRFRHEAVLFRRCFLVFLVLGLLGLTGGTVAFIFENVILESDDAGTLASIGFIWFCAGVGGLIASVVVASGRFRWLLRACAAMLVILCGAWLVYGLSGGFNQSRSDGILINLTYASVFVLVWIGFAYVLTIDSRTPLHDVFRKVLAYSLLTSTLAGLVCDIFDVWRIADWLVTALTWWAVVSVFGIGALQIALRWEKRPRADNVRTISNRARLVMTCPECGEWSELPHGPTRCDACGIRLIVNVEEPRCECGYLLYRLVGDKCPECGKPIATEVQASAT